MDKRNPWPRQPPLPPSRHSYSQRPTNPTRGTTYNLANHSTADFPLQPPHQRFATPRPFGLSQASGFPPRGMISRPSQIHQFSIPPPLPCTNTLPPVRNPHRNIGPDISLPPPQQGTPPLPQHQGPPPARFLQGNIHGNNPTQVKDTNSDVMNMQQLKMWIKDNIYKAPMAVINRLSPQQMVQILTPGELQFLVGKFSAKQFDFLLTTMDSSQLKLFAQILTPTIIQHLSASQAKCLITYMNQNQVDQLLNAIDSNRFQELVNVLDTPNFQKLIGNVTSQRMLTFLNSGHPQKTEQWLNSLTKERQNAIMLLTSAGHAIPSASIGLNGPPPSMPQMGQPPGLSPQLRMNQSRPGMPRLPSGMEISQPPPPHESCPPLLQLPPPLPPSESATNMTPSSIIQREERIRPTPTFENQDSVERRPNQSPMKRGDDRRDDRWDFRRQDSPRSSDSPSRMLPRKRPLEERNRSPSRQRRRSRSRSGERASAFTRPLDSHQPFPRQSTKPYRWISSTPAQLYFQIDRKTGNTVSTSQMVDLEETFDKTILCKFRDARERQTKIEYPSQKAKHNHHNCQEHHNHKPDESESSSDSSSSESDTSNKSDDESDGEMSDVEEEEVAKFNEEMEAKLKHPDKMHRELWFNDKGQLNSRPRCLCSRRNQRHGPRHERFQGETLLPKCDPRSNNADKLHHYRLIVRETTNFKDRDSMVTTSIHYDGRDYKFDGWSIFTHQKIDQMPELDIWMYKNYYTFVLVEEMAPENFSVRSLDMLTDYIIHDLLELQDLEWAQEQFRDGCRQIHMLPRFVRRLPETGQELLSSHVILQYLLESHKPLVEEIDIPKFVDMDAETRLAKLKSVQGTLVTLPGKKPSTIRLDNLDMRSAGQDRICWPEVVHMTRRPVEMSYMGDPRYIRLKRQLRKLKNFYANRLSQGNKEDFAKMRLIENEIEEIANKSELKREMNISVSAEGFYRTGLRCDLTQNALILPKVVMHIRFHQSLIHLQTILGYQFKDLKLLQLSMTHPSHANGFSSNVDHIKNTLTNCGLRRPQYGCHNGKPPAYKNKKRGLVNLLQTMSKFRGDEDRGAVIDYERLEFLGDAVLELITSVHLFYMFPDLFEGGLAAYRTALVKNEHLTQLAQKLHLEDYLLITHYDANMCNRSNINAALADAFEALLGALYVDGGIQISDMVLTKALAMEFYFEEFFHSWADLPVHPLQLYDEATDRQVVSTNPSMSKAIEFENASGIKFDHVRLLARALTHCSFPYNEITMGHNQTLEFLGDAVLQLITTEFLYNKYPTHYEGPLSLLRSSIVNNMTQADIYKDLELQKYIMRNGKGKPVLKERADYVEAIIGALYIDQGLEICRGFCQVVFFTRLQDIIQRQSWNDPKSQLQQCCLYMRKPMHGASPEIPIYKTLEAKGPTNNRMFKVAVYFRGQRLADGSGESIQKSQMQAATKALLENKEMFKLKQQMTRYYEAKLDRDFEEEAAESGYKH